MFNYPTFMYTLDLESKTFVVKFITRKTSVACNTLKSEKQTSHVLLPFFIKRKKI